MASPLLFHVFRDGGAVTGPHPSAVLRRELESGDVSMETQVCLDGTQDWLPLSDWLDDIQPAAQRAAAAPRSVTYAQIVSAPPKNTPLRIFWGVLLLLAGISQALYCLDYYQANSRDRPGHELHPDDRMVLYLMALMCLMWLYIGTRLMWARKSK